MRHGKKINHLSRKSAHRSAMLSNMAASLILNKRISTTVAKAKALKKYVEPLVNRSKEDTTHSRRMVFRYLQSKEAVQELFSDVSTKIGDRPGGYTRILKTGSRLGDNADMCFIELVDYNDTYTKEEKTGRKRRRTRRGGSSAATGSETSTTPETKKEEDTTVTQAEVMEEQADKDETTAEKEQEITDVSTQEEGTEEEDKEEENKENK